MTDLKFSKEAQTGRKPKEPKRKTSLPGQSEKDLQRMCEELVKVYGLANVRIPDSAYKAIFANRNVDQFSRIHIAMFLKGLPDLIILKPDGDYNKALCVELKVGTNKLSQGQLKFASKANVHLIKRFEDFEQLLKEFLK